MSFHVFFDLDDTLLAHSEASVEGARHLRLSFEPLRALDEERFLRDWPELTERHMEVFFRGEVSFADQRRARMRELFGWASATIDEAEADAAFETYIEGYRKAWRPFEDVEPTLRRLAEEDVYCGVITNGRVEAQRRKLEALELLDRFAPIVITEEVGVHKPAARVFEEAAQRAGRPLSSCVYVGDKRETDALAARRAGMRGVWLDRRQRGSGERALPRIESLSELPDLLARLSR